MSDWTAYHTPESVRREFRPEGSIERSRLLDRPSDPHPILNALMDEALMRITFVSDGAVMALRERVTGSRSANAPSSDLAATLEVFGWRYGQCKTHRRRLEVIKEAQATAVRLRYSPDREYIADTKEWREKVAHDPRDNGTVVLAYGITERRLQRIRKEFGTNRPRGGVRQTTRLAK